MLHIRSEQFRILDRDALVNRLVAHAQAVAPAVCAPLTFQHLQSIVEYCLDRCAFHGIVRDYDIMRYLNLMLVFGVTFDWDEQWAAEPLAHPNAATRMELLMDQAMMQSKPSTAAHHE